MSILLVRHGETAGNVERVLQHAAVPLNPRGQRQAQHVAERLSGHPVERVLASDLLRARMTADAICTRLALPLHTSPLLVERDFGDLRGVPYDSLEHNPFAPDFVPPNGESWSAFHDRVADAFARVVAVAAGLRGDLVVVTHGLVCRALAQRHLQLTADQVLPGRFANTGVTVFESAPPHRVATLDCTAHLSAEDKRDASSGGAA